MALVLLVSAGLMIRTFEALRTVEPGFTHARASADDAHLRFPLHWLPTHNRSRGYKTILPTSWRRFQASPPWDSRARCRWKESNPTGTRFMSRARAYGAATPPLRLFKNVSPEFFHDDRHQTHCRPRTHMDGGLRPEASGDGFGESRPRTLGHAICRARQTNPGVPRHAAGRR